MVGGGIEVARARRRESQSNMVVGVAVAVAAVLLVLVLCNVLLKCCVPCCLYVYDCKLL